MNIPWPTRPRPQFPARPYIRPQVSLLPSQPVQPMDELGLLLARIPPATVEPDPPGVGFKGVMRPDMDPDGPFGTRIPEHRIVPSAADQPEPKNPWDLAWSRLTEQERQ